MCERIVEKGLRKTIEDSEVCPWLQKQKYLPDMDWGKSLCKPDCDGKDINCRYHPVNRVLHVKHYQWPVSELH
ncbi:MAG: hypothetical protein AABX54_03835 [Nanoarchaeota archaeon]